MKTSQTAEKMNNRSDELPEEKAYAELWRRAWRDPSVPPELERCILAEAGARANAFRLRRLNRSRRWCMAAALFLVSAAALAGLCWPYWQGRDGDGERALTAGVSARALAADDAGAVEQAVAALNDRTGLPDYTWDDFDDRLLQLEQSVALTRMAGSMDFTGNNF